MARCDANTQGGSRHAPRCSEDATWYVVIYGSKVKYCDKHAERYGRGKQKPYVPRKRKVKDGE